jgi:hypothetical protein
MIACFLFRRWILLVFTIYSSELIRPCQMLTLCHLWILTFKKILLNIKHCWRIKIIQTHIDLSTILLNSMLILIDNCLWR